MFQADHHYDREDALERPWEFELSAEFPEARIGANVGYISARISGEQDEDHNVESNTVVIDVLEVELGADQLYAVPLDDATRTAIEDAIREWVILDPQQEVEWALRDGLSSVSGNLTVRLPGEKSKAA